MTIAGQLFEQRNWQNLGDYLREEFGLNEWRKICANLTLTFAFPKIDFVMSTPDRFVADTLQNINNRTILERWDELNFPDGWLVAGCLFQTVWNLKSQRNPEDSIKDYDLFYFDSLHTTDTAEQQIQARAEHVLRDLDIKIEVSNQARVHLWYESYFGRPYEALRSCTDGIDRFLIPSTCVGIRPGELYVPNGFELIYDGVLTLNPLTPYRDLFQQKAASYQERWPWLKIVAPDLES